MTDRARSEKIAALRAYLDELDEQTGQPNEPPLREAVARGGVMPDAGRKASRSTKPDVSERRHEGPCPECCPWRPDARVRYRCDRHHQECER